MQPGTNKLKEIHASLLVINVRLSIAMLDRKEL